VGTGALNTGGTIQRENTCCVAVGGLALTFALYAPFCGSSVCNDVERTPLRRGGTICCFPGDPSCS
jgi:hypothetical protein